MPKVNKVIYSNILTINNLNEWVTYIYYADDEQGTNATVTPEDKDYIGIYNGPAIKGGQPSTPPQETKWSKYVGKDGAQADSIILYNEYPQIFRFPNNNKTSFSPSNFSITLKNIQTNEQIQLTEKDEVSFYFLSGGRWLEVNENSFVTSGGLFENRRYLFWNEGVSEGVSIKFNTLRELLQESPSGWPLYEKFFLGESAFKIIAKVKGRRYEKIWPVVFGSNEDMAKFSLKSEGLYLSILNQKTEFNAEGLEITNGGFKLISNKGENNQKIVANFDQQGNLTMQGLKATQGEFKGKIEATSGILDQLSIQNSLVINSGENKMYIGNTFYEETSGEIDKNKQYYEYDAINNVYIKKEWPDNITIIPSDQLYYQAISVKGIKSSNYIQNKQGFSIDVNGDINASNLTLGQNATIANKMIIGDGERCQILNPNLNNSNFILVQDSDKKVIFSLNNKGEMKLGDLNLFGSSSTIQTNNYHEKQGWSISPQEATFNNITVRGSIETSVFKYGEISAIGGMLLVRPSSIIKEVQQQKDGKIELFLKEAKGFDIGGYCILSKNNKKYYFKVESISDTGDSITVSQDQDDSNSEVILFSGTTSSMNTLAIEEMKNEVITYLGIRETDTQEGSIGICINGSDDSDSFTPSRAITVFTQGRRAGDFKNKIILGKIPNDKNIYGRIAGTYGLFSENVLLKGSLITKTSSGIPSYSGISTVYGGSSETIPTTRTLEGQKLFPGAKYTNSLGQEDWHLGEILLWAGANSDSKEDIENAKFRVDKFGNLYAGSGYFSGTIITNASITAARIKTATIEGSNDYLKEDNTYNSPALNIVNAAHGIRFAESDNLESRTYMSLTDKSLELNVPLKLQKDLELTENLILNKIIIKKEESTKNKISGSSITSNYLSLWYQEETNEKVEKQKTLINRTSAGLEFQNSKNLDNDLTENFDEVAFIIGTEKEDNISPKNLKLNKSLKFGENVECKTLENGFDIYIK